MDFIELLKAAFLGVVEGITEWLPISSTGHMILVDEFIKLDVSAAFLEMFLVVIQLGAILAVIILYFHKLNPFSPKKTVQQKRETLSLWGKVAVGSIPAAILGILFDDWVNDHFFTATTVAIALIVYGIAFIVIEHINRRKAENLAAGTRFKHASSDTERQGIAQQEQGTEGDPAQSIEGYAKINSFEQMGLRTALIIGVFQTLAIIPGTSRSGSTILGSMIMGVSRTIAAEFAFFLAIPIMFGWSLIKVLKFVFIEKVAMTGTEIGVLIVGCVVAFVVSVLAIKFLMGYIKKHDFTIFGWYRIVLGIAVLAYFFFIGGSAVVGA